MSYLEHLARCERVGARPLGYAHWLRVRARAAGSVGWTCETEGAAASFGTFLGK